LWHLIADDIIIGANSVVNKTLSEEGIVIAGIPAKKNKIEIMFSVVIPLYNKEEQIRKTIDSVLNQTFNDFEIVIVNDGSKDKSVDIVQSINDPRIRLINQENGGVSAARNRGIKEAKNKWIAFLDADDIWKSNKLEEVAKVIRSNEGISWIVTGLETVKGQRKKIEVYKKKGFLIDPLIDIKKGLYIQTSSVLVKKDLFLTNPELLFRVGLNRSEDREVWYKLIFRYPNLYYLNSNLATYIRESGNETLASRVNYEFLDIINRLQPELEKLPKIRRRRFLNLENSIMRKNILYLWLNFNIQEFSKYPFLSSIDIVLLRSFNSAPKSIKLFLVRLLSRF